MYFYDNEGGHLGHHRIFSARSIMPIRTVRNPAVVITGASSGIGQATAFAMAKRGGHLGLVARRADRLEAIAAEIRSRGGQAVALPCDVTDADAVQKAVEACVAHFGRLDVLINNAGIGLFATIEQTTAQDLDRLLATNLRGPFYAVKAALPFMRHQGSGHIVNVASTAGRRGSPYIGAYCASKFAMVGFTESLRVELLDTGIHVSLICPGATRTEFFDVTERRTPRHSGLVGPIESPERVAGRIVSVVGRPRREVMAQPFRRKVFFTLNLFAPGLIDRFLAWLIGGEQNRQSRKKRFL